ncbi:N-acetylmuramoyl-L-alanine amidase [Pendulispora brunnea]|uniref:N-acetylmuramoyl-L-alanine amidase n=1 Tax=Pendulispora brunnea TaxID=2905690 RepID=A0ABZ2KDZ8_9BACT
MSGVVVNGALEAIPGLVCTSWHDDPRVRLRIGEDGAARPRGTWVRGITLHSTRGIPGGSDRRAQRILPGLGPTRSTALATNQWWSRNGQSAGAHLVVDFDATVVCLADLATEQTYHATSVNPVTIGIEIAQGSEADFWEQQLEAVVALVDWLTLRFSIQRQVPDRYRGPLDRLRRGARDYVGVFGHRDQSAMRGPGDPGDAIFERLVAAGYEPVDISAGDDLRAWRQRQRVLGVAEDGIPGPATCSALRQFQEQHGLTPTGIADAATRRALEAPDGDRT